MSPHVPDADLIATLAAKVVAEYLRGMESSGARNLPTESLTIADVGRLGGIARARALSPQRRREIARRASEAALASRRERAAARQRSAPRPISASEAGRRGGTAGKGRKRPRKSVPKKRA